MATVDRLPRYLCTQTVDRSALLPTAEVTGRSCDDLAKRREKPNGKVRESQSDRLRLDVAVSSEVRCTPGLVKIDFETAVWLT